MLFVCTGNICRSPTAERLTAAWAEESGVGIDVSSAGTRAVVDAPMDPTAAAVLQGLGGDPAGFTSRQLVPEQVESADLVLTMTGRHRTQVLEADPSALHRAFTLREAARLAQHVIIGEGFVEQLAALRSRFPAVDEDIEDPFRLDEEVYEQVGAVIADALLIILPHLAGGAALRDEAGDGSDETDPPQ